MPARDQEDCMRGSMWRALRLQCRDMPVWLALSIRDVADGVSWDAYARRGQSRIEHG